MVLIYLVNGDCIELREGYSVEQDDHTITCFNLDGEEIATYSAYDVVAFTSDPATVNTMKEEVCDDLTTVPPGPAASSS
jgi:hypothetical protein